MICGYPKRPIGEHGEFELKEVSFGMTPSALREIAHFLESAAEEVEKGTEGIYWHRHIDSHIHDWRERYPDIDVVVVDLESY